MARIRPGRWIAAVLGAVLLTGVTVPYLNAEGYRARIQEALERALNRRVKVGKVHFNLFTGPGFTVKDVEINDDPSVGIEPLAYVETLEARVTPATLWTRRLSFSNLKLKDPTLNLVKSDSGVWNFQLLNAAGAVPSIQVRNGRINFKFGDTKSVFFLSESDLDVVPLDGGRVDVRFAGQPARTDQAARSLGQLLARGIWKRNEGAEAELDINAELERSGISELARIVRGNTIGLHGVVSSKARIAGPVSRLAIQGQLKLDDVHRWDLVERGGATQLNYRGQVDLKAQRVELETAEKDNPGSRVRFRFRASDLLSEPRWAASVDFREMPAAAVLDAARHLGTQLPEGIQAEGRLSGAVTYSMPGGFQGKLAAMEATLRSPDAPVLKFQSADVVIEGGTIKVGPSTVEAESGQAAELVAEYDLGSRDLDVSISTAGMNAGELRKSAGVHVPVLSGLEQGIWKGVLRYRKAAETDGEWSGEGELRDARAEVAGLAEPVRLTTASVTVSGKRFALTRMRGRVGAIKFGGEYRGDGGKADHFKLDAAEAEVSELERVFMPTLRRRQDLLARFRLRQAPAPEWLRERRLDGTIRIGRLKAGDLVWQLDSASVDWNGVRVKVNQIEASQGEAAAEGQMTLDLSSAAPAYRIEGKLSGLRWKGGSIGLTGTLETRGTGLSAAGSAHAEGTFDGESLAFSTEMEFKTISGEFDWTAPSKFRVKSIQAEQGFETYSGQGATQADGKLLLELITSGKRQVKVAGTLFPVAGR